MEEELCTTPKNQECRIQAPVVCPPAPRKKKNENRPAKRYQQPKNGYFHPPDLDSFFAVATGVGARVVVMSSAKNSEIQNSANFMTYSVKYVYTMAIH
ncbi:hypothetical protein RND71_038739 [Anisodus tanguticus]|uniref:Uncharacterized protein n=1 Tax=Anisodus tanguticus TaxID=243964 RepID=A0AAE1USD8_9SOLA|nr:hypothetical protein RND71_038739 [Anisodus tanguticus]